MLKDMTRESEDMVSVLDRLGIGLNEHLGQHLMVDRFALQSVANQVQGGANVLEIGAGPGNLTQLIAERASKVVAIEIDERFKPALERTVSRARNVEVQYRDALTINFRNIVHRGWFGRDWQIVANLPYHISEPFLRKIIGLPIENAVLVVGDSLAEALQVEDPRSRDFTKTSLLGMAFFDVRLIARFPKSSFYPAPRTNSALIVLTPLEEKEADRTPWRRAIRQMFLTESKNPTVAKIVKQVLDSLGRGTGSDRRDHKAERRSERRLLKGMVHSQDFEETGPGQRQTLKLEDLGIPSRILSTPFSRLSSEETRTLVVALMDRLR